MAPVYDEPTPLPQTRFTQSFARWVEIVRALDAQGDTRLADRFRQMPITIQAAGITASNALLWAGADATEFPHDLETRADLVSRHDHDDGIDAEQ